MVRPVTQPCRERTQANPVLVLGVGNILLRDEGVGVRAVEAMQRMGARPGVELFDGGTSGIDLLDVIADRRKVVVIDAVDGDFEPGTVLRLSPDDLASRTVQDASLHDIGLFETLAMARHLGVAPDEVVIFGVKPETIEWGLELSPRIAELIPRLIQQVIAELEA